MKRCSTSFLNRKNHHPIAYIDVGGTTTHVIVTDEQKNILKNFAFPSRPSALKTQLQSALEPFRKPKRVLIGIRGVWTPKEKKLWRNDLKNLGEKVTIFSDIELAHRLVFGKASGIVLNAGTGSIALGKIGKRWARAGGLGPFLGDEGSGFWIGREYLKALYRKSRKLGILRKYAKHPEPVLAIAGLAKKVIEKAYRQKDATCLGIVQEAQNHLLSLVWEVQKRCGRKKTIRIELTGGLFKNKRFRRTFENLLHEKTINQLVTKPLI